MTTIDSLAVDAAKAMSTGSSNIFLSVAGRWGKTSTRRLCGKNSPTGEIVSQVSDNAMMVCFNAVEILAWRVANGATSVSVSVVEKTGEDTATP